MSKKLRRYSLRRIKDNYTYTVEQIADLFGINVNTVRRWISEEGLKRLPMTRPHLVHSSDLKRFLERKQKSRKKPCAEHELFCCKCQMPRSPKLDTGSLILNPNNTVLFGARCSVCDTKIHKAVKGEKWDENHPLARYLHGATKQHNGVNNSPRKCETEKGEQLWLDLTP